MHAGARACEQQNYNPDHRSIRKSLLIVHEKISQLNQAEIGMALIFTNYKTTLIRPYNCHC